MVTARVVEFDPASGRYSLPAEHAAFLTRAAAADNMAVFAQYVRILGGVEDHIVRCFREGGGVPYAEFARFHEVMAEDSGQSVMSSLESHILPLVPGLQGAADRRHSRARRRLRPRPHLPSACRAVSAEPVRRHGPLA